MAVLNFYHLNKVIPDTAVYVGRRNVKFGLPQSPFANPEPLKDESDRAANLQRYQGWLWNNLKTGRITEAQLLELEHKDVVCYCAPKACHGDVVSRAVAWAVRRRDAGLTGTPVAPHASASVAQPPGESPRRASSKP